MRVLFSHLIALAFLAAFTTCGFSTHGLNYALAQSNEDTEGRPKPNPTGNPRISCSDGCTVVACGTCNSCADNPCSSGRVCEKCEGHLCCCCPKANPTPEECKCTNPVGNDGEKICDNSRTPGKIRTCSAIALPSRGCVASWNDSTCDLSLRICEVVDGTPTCRPDCSNKAGALCEGSPQDGHIRENECDPNTEVTKNADQYGVFACCCPKNSCSECPNGAEDNVFRCSGNNLELCTLNPLDSTCKWIRAGCRSGEVCTGTKPDAKCEPAQK